MIVNRETYDSFALMVPADDMERWWWCGVDVGVDVERASSVSTLTHLCVGGVPCLRAQPWRVTVDIDT